MIFRIYKIAAPKIELNEENELYNTFTLFYEGKVPLDEKPISGRFILFFPYFILKNYAKIETITLQKYLRAMTGLLSSLVPPLITCSLFLSNLNDFSSTIAGILLSLDPCIIISSRSYTTDSFFLFFASLVIFLSALEKHFWHPLLVQFQCLCAVLAFSTDYVGFLCILYLFFSTKNKRRLLPDLLSLTSIFSFIEILMKAMFSEEVGDELSNAPLKIQIFETVKRMKQMLPMEPSINDFFKYPLCQVYPHNYIKMENCRICALYSIPLIIFIDIAIIFKPFEISSVFYWLSLFVIWLFKPLNIYNYLLPLIFGIMSFAKLIDSKSTKTRYIITFICLILSAIFFIIYSRWTYGLSINPTFDKLINIWKI